MAGCCGIVTFKTLFLIKLIFDRTMFSETSAAKNFSVLKNTPGFASHDFSLPSPVHHELCLKQRK